MARRVWSIASSFGYSRPWRSRRANTAGELLQADPTLAPQFLGAVRRRQATADVDVDQGGWSASEDEVRVRWAYAEARQLLQRYASVREALQERMAAGVSAGECVLLIEERLKNSWGAV